MAQGTIELTGEKLETATENTITLMESGKKIQELHYATLTDTERAGQTFDSDFTPSSIAAAAIVQAKIEGVPVEVTYVHANDLTETGAIDPKIKAGKREEVDLAKFSIKDTTFVIPVNIIDPQIRGELGLDKPEKTQPLADYIKERNDEIALKGEKSGTLAELRAEYQAAADAIVENRLTQKSGVLSNIEAISIANLNEQESISLGDIKDKNPTLAKEIRTELSGLKRDYIEGKNDAIEAAERFRDEGKDGKADKLEARADKDAEIAESLAARIKELGIEVEKPKQPTTKISKPTVEATITVEEPLQSQEAAPKTEKEKDNKITSSGFTDLDKKVAESGIKLASEVPAFNSSREPIALTRKEPETGATYETGTYETGYVRDNNNSRKLDKLINSTIDNIMPYQKGEGLEEIRAANGLPTKKAEIVSISNGEKTLEQAESQNR